MRPGALGRRARALFRSYRRSPLASAPPQGRPSNRVREPWRGEAEDTNPCACSPTSSHPVAIRQRLELEVEPPSAVSRA